MKGMELLCCLVVCRDISVSFAKWQQGEQTISISFPVMCCVWTMPVCDVSMQDVFLSFIFSVLFLGGSQRWLFQGTLRCPHASPQLQWCRQGCVFGKIVDLLSIWTLIVVCHTADDDRVVCILHSRVVLMSGGAVMGEQCVQCEWEEAEHTVLAGALVWALPYRCDCKFVLSGVRYPVAECGTGVFQSASWVRLYWMLRWSQHTASCVAILGCPWWAQQVEY